MIKWRPNASSGHDFDFTQHSTQLSNWLYTQICLTKNDKNLLIGSNKLLSVFDTETRSIKKEF